MKPRGPGPHRNKLLCGLTRYRLAFTVAKPYSLYKNFHDPLQGTNSPEPVDHHYLFCSVSIHTAHNLGV